MVRVSRSSGWPGTCYVAEGDPEQLPIFVSLVLGLQTGHHAALMGCWGRNSVLRACYFMNSTYCAIANTF